MFINDFGKLLIYQEKESKDFAFSSIFLPPSSEKEKWGRLFVISKIYKPTEKDKKFFLQLIENLKDSYYNLSLTSLEKTFEQALHKLNQKISKEISQGTNLEWLKKSDILIGLIKEESVYFAQIGNIQVYLLRQNNLVNILSSLGSSDTTLNPIKVFSHIISGNLKKDDSLLFCTNNFFDYLSLEKVKKIIQQYSATEIIEHFQKLLKEINKQISFAGIVIKHHFISKATIQEKTIKKEKLSLTSMKNLVRKEKTTEKILRPLTFPKIKPFYQNLIQKLKGKKIPPLLNIKYKKQKFIYSLIKLPTILYHFFRTTVTRLKTILQPKNLVSYFEEKKKKVKKLPRLRRIVLIITIIFAFTFIASLFWIGQSQQKKESRKNIDQTIQEIEKKQSIAFSAVVYNEERARKNLEEVEELIKNLPQKLSRKQRKKIALLSKKNQQELEKLRHINISENPEELADFWLTDQELVNIQKIIYLDSNIYTWNPKNNFIYKLDISTKKISLESNIPQNIGYLQQATKLDENNLIFYQTDQGLAKFDTKEKILSPLEIVPKIFSKEINDLVFYQKKLYLLDSQKNQIYKFYKTDNGFGNGSTWLKEKIDLSKASSLAIDGSIYVSTIDGKILKFYLGKKQEFKTNIKPDLESPTKIITNLDWNNIYILDPPTKRLIVLDKNGRLKNQYVSNKFDNLKDFAVDEKNGIIYLLNGTKIYKITKQ